MHTQRTPNSCGPDSLASAAGLPAAAVDAAWVPPIRDIARFRDSSDSPIHHKAALRNLGQRRRIVTLAQILAREVQPGRVVVLMHQPGNPFLAQHWAVYHGHMEATDGPKIRMAMGDGRCVGFSVSTFTRCYAGGAPACAYEVGVGEIPELGIAERVWLGLCRYLRW